MVLTKGLSRERNAVRYQFIIDLLDVWIPATNLGYVNLNDGVLGLFGYVCLGRPSEECINNASLVL